MITRFDLLNILLKIKKDPDLSQRALASQVGYSLGKLNYVIKLLKDQGLIKINNFKNSKSKLNYLYILTPKGVSEKTRLTLSFMKLRLKEYDELRLEYEKEKRKK